MGQPEHIETIEKRLWAAADILRTNANHDGGECFTPVSLVSLIANILEPVGGAAPDPARGSGGMKNHSLATGASV